MARKKLKRLKNRLYQGDCLEVMKDIPTESVHAVVCDPPYELGFMGKSWDNTGIAYNVDVWRECLRVLKPGGIILAFGGSRTQHRLAVAIEDAGFEIMNCLGWIFGSGFPKATDVSKMIDKRAGHWRGRAGIVVPENKSMSGGNYERTNSGEPITSRAKYWDGYKYSIVPLKPALEIVIMGRKPFDGKPLDSIIEHEVGAINVDGCRVKTSENLNGGGYDPENKSNKIEGDASSYYTKTMNQEFQQPEGRYPPNLMIDATGADVIGEQNGNASRYFPQFNHDDEPPFLYCPKVSKKERNAHGENKHPTIKPLKLITWLVTLVTREKQTVLDPFSGSGTTGEACRSLGRGFILIEKEPEYCEVIKNRLPNVQIFS